MICGRCTRPPSAISPRAYWVNEFGTWIGEVALALLVYNRTHSPLATAGLFLTLRFLPALLAPLLTTRLEALPPRVVLSTLYVLEAVLFAAIAVITRHFSLPAILVLAALDGALAVTAKALTRGASASGLIKQGLLREGNGIMNLGAMVSTASSPLIAGGLVAWKGAESALLVDAATFLVTALIIVTASGIHVDSDHDAGSSGRLRNGLDVLRNRRAVRRLMIAIAFAMTLSAVPIPIEVVFAKHTLHAGDTGYGLLLASWGLGMVIGGAVFAAVKHVRLTSCSPGARWLWHSGMAAWPPRPRSRSPASSPPSAASATAPPGSRPSRPSRNASR